MSEKIKLDKRHPCSLAHEQRYKLWGDLYEGGTRVEKESSYLVRHPFESEKQYAIRMERACYKNYAAPIVTVFSASLWRKLPVRTLDPALEALLEDVDMQGGTADKFFISLTRRVAAVGAQFVLVDMPRVDKPSTLAEDKAAGRRPYFVMVDATDVLDWGFDSFGVLEWVVIRERVTLSDEPFGERKERKQYRVLRRDGWELWAKKEEAGGQDDVAIKIDEGSYDLGRVPLVPCMFEEASPMVGNSCLDDVASLCLRVYRRDSELDKALFDAAIPLLFSKGFSSEEVAGFVRSSSNAMATTNNDADIRYVEPEGKSFQALKTANDDDIQAIREIALRQIRPETRQREAAEAKRMDLAQLNSALYRFSTAVADCEERCWNLAAAWLGLKGEASVEYNDDFSEQEISGDLLKAFADLRRGGDLSRDTLFDLLKRWEVLPSDFDSQDEAARLENEGRSSVQAGAPAQGSDLFAQGLTGKLPT